MRFDPYVNGGSGQRGMLAVAGELSSGPLDPGLCHRVEVRVSKIAGAFCLGLNGDGVRQAGVERSKGDLVAGWQDPAAFSERERAALDLAEAMTRGGDGRGVNEATWRAARDQFQGHELAALLHLFDLTNVWNRINVAVELPTDPRFPRLEAPR
jgi:alkylhydroperoxidase family enzyme